MIRRFKAVYYGGAFVPNEPVSLAEGTQVEVVLDHDSVVISPEVTDPTERKLILDDVIASMEGHPLTTPVDSITRDSLHERR